MAEVVWTENALDNLREIGDFIAQHSPAKADEVTEQLSEAPNILIHSPRAGRRVPDFDLDHIRELVMVRPYRIIYVVREETCYIASILHGRRDLRRAIRLEDLEDIAPENN